MARTEIEARKAFVALVEPLAQALRADVDLATWGVYYRALKDVPTGLLVAAVDRLLREPRTFFPKAQEIRAAAENERQALLLANPYDGCVECEMSKGWVEVLGADGRPSHVQRCPCFGRHQERIAQLGVGGPLLLSAGDSEAA